MVSTPEVRVKRKVKEVLKDLGAYYVMPVTSGYGNSGAPDFIVCLRGRFVGIECKAGNNKVTVLQRHNLDLIKTAGGIDLVVNDENVGELKSILVNLIQGEVNET